MMAQARYIYYFILCATGIIYKVCFARDPRYIHCYQHSIVSGEDKRDWTFRVLADLPGGNISVNMCLVECRVHNFTFAGLIGNTSQFIECLCGDTPHDDYSRVLQSSHDICNVVCPLDPGDTCGKYYRYNAYISLYYAECLEGWEGIRCDISWSNYSMDISTATTTVTESTSTVENDIGKPSGMTLTIVIALVSTLVLTSCIILILCIKRRRKKDDSIPPSDALQNVRVMGKADDAGNPASPQHPAPVTEDGSAMVPLSHLVPSTYSKSEEENKIYEQIYVNQNIRRPIKLPQLAEHIASMKSKNAFEKEFENLPSGRMARCTLGEHRALLRAKNRYKTILAYDHSGVLLEMENDNPTSRYINANYINGYNSEKEFIAAQGPMLTTLEDFWRMIWEQKVQVVVMLTNIKEQGKNKCERYWPEKSECKFGRYEVTLRKVETWPDYTIRNLKLTQGKSSRSVRQFHFTVWPDHGVPQHASPLLTFRRKVRLAMSKTGGPAVVHCSAGIGRTGAFLALDYLLKQAQAEGMVDISTCVSLLRANRCHMVQTEDQYIFIHDSLLEATTLGETVIPCFQFDTLYNEMMQENEYSGTTKLYEQFMLLQKLNHPHSKAAFKTATKPENASKNRDESILPPDFNRPYLSQSASAGSYINAVFVKGYRTDRAFLVTQKPLENTKDDLWRMVHEFRCPVVVAILDPDDSEKDNYWPSQGQDITFGQMKVSGVDTISEADNVEEFKLKVEKTGAGATSGKDMTLFVVKWTPEGDPFGPGKRLVATCNRLQRVQQQAESDGPVVIQCLYGSFRSGTLCALITLINMINTEQEVDVFHVARQIRSNRPQLIHTQAQFEYLYELVRLYLKSFETYANFS